MIVRVVSAVLALLVLGSVATHAEGLTRPQVLPPFDPSRATCASPPSRSRVLYFAQDNDRQFMQGAAAGLASAARDRNMEFRIGLANNDPHRRSILLMRPGGQVLVL